MADVRKLVKQEVAGGIAGFRAQPRPSSAEIKLLKQFMARSPWPVCLIQRLGGNAGITFCKTFD